MAPHRVILLPGAVLPAELASKDLKAALGPEADMVAKDLELYAAGEPGPDYSLDLEVEGVLREAHSRGWERFHFVGYSAGGAAALASPPATRTGCSAWLCWSRRGQVAGTGRRSTASSGPRRSA